jgi:hypothetical protein
MTTLTTCFQRLRLRRPKNWVDEIAKQPADKQEAWLSGYVYGVGAGLKIALAFALAGVNIGMAIALVTMKLRGVI